MNNQIAVTVPIDAFVNAINERLADPVFIGHIAREVLDKSGFRAALTSMMSDVTKALMKTLTDESLKNTIQEVVAKTATSLATTAMAEEAGIIAMKSIVAAGVRKMR